VPQARAVLLKAAAASAEVKKSAVAWLGLGRLEEQEGVVLSAELAYRSAVSADDSVTTNLRLAQFLERSARVDDAEKVLKHVDSLRPSEPSALADFQLIAGRPADALKSYETNGANAGLNASRLIEAQMQAERGAKTAPDAKTLLAKYRDVLDGTVGAVLDSEAALAEGDLARAEVHAINAVTRGPRSATAHYIRGVIFNYQHKVAEAKAEWNSALDAEPEYVPAQLALARQNLQEQDLLTAEEHASSVVRDEPANLDALCLYARVLMAQGRTASARGIARRALSVNGKSAEARVIMGQIEMQAHRYGPAFMEFQRALLLNSQSVEAMDGLLDVYRHGVITLAALNKMERVAAAPPVSVPLLEITGRLYADRRLNKDAVRVLKRVIEIDPARHTAALALAEAHYALGDEKSASELMMSGSTIVSPGFLKLRAAEAQERGDSESAIQDYESAVNSGDASGVVANNLAWAYAQRGVKLDRALELATSAVERNPKNPAVLDTLGVVQLKRRNYSEAVEALQKASLLMDSPEWKLQRAEVYRHLAEAYLGAGLSIRAADAMEKTGK